MLGTFTYSGDNVYSAGNTSTGYQVYAGGNDPSYITLKIDNSTTRNNKKYLKLAYTLTGSGSAYISIGTKQTILSNSSTEKVILTDVSDLDNDVVYQIRAYCSCGTGATKSLLIKYLAYVDK